VTLSGRNQTGDNRLPKKTPKIGGKEGGGGPKLKSAMGEFEDVGGICKGRDPKPAGTKRQKGMFGGEQSCGEPANTSDKEKSKDKSLNGKPNQDKLTYRGKLKRLCFVQRKAGSGAKLTFLQAYGKSIKRKREGVLKKLRQKKDQGVS